MARRLSGKHSVLGRLTCNFIPGETRRISVVDPIVTLEFECEGGGTLQLFVHTGENAASIYESLSEQIHVDKGWSRPLMISTPRKEA